MSRVGKQLILIPQGVEITIDKDIVRAKGPKGELQVKVPANITVVIEEQNVKVRRKNQEKETRSLHGLTRNLINNIIIGVHTGFEKQLEIIGVGYRAEATGSKIKLSLGFSHPVEFQAPQGITLEMGGEKKNVIIVKGIDKQVVGAVAAKIRSYREPEPYKGKGIRYVGEYVARKAGKTAAK